MLSIDDVMLGDYLRLIPPRGSGWKQRIHLLRKGQLSSVWSGFDLEEPRAGGLGG